MEVKVMKKQITYFNFGLILSVLVVAAQFMMFLVNTFIVVPELINFLLPPVLIIFLSLLWYKSERSFLKIDQYWIAINPLLLFITVVLANLLRKDDFLNWHNALLIIFLVFYVILRIEVHNLSIKFSEEAYGNKLGLRSLAYLMFCAGLVGLWTYIFFL
jgi:hypothetical protein